ncbi:MAG: hypothetical protein GSR80_000363 [Desulfurococcales archaeon]|nr:hypothetical protein [Desulfurococcales archaeon]
MAPSHGPEGEWLIIGLPYYPVGRLGETGRTLFYGEAHLSIAAGDLYFFALATPKTPPGDEPGPEALRLKPLLHPGEYARRAMEASERIFSEANVPEASFHVGGLKGMLKAVIAHLTGRQEKNPIRATPRLEWRLASEYLKGILKVRPGERLQVNGPLRYVKVGVRPGERGFEAVIWRRGRPEEFRVLEILSRRSPSVGEALEALWGEARH